MATKTTSAGSARTTAATSNSPTKPEIVASGAALSASCAAPGSVGAAMFATASPSTRMSLVV